MNAYGENAVGREVPYLPVPGLQIKLSWCGVTDVGSRREINEDSYVMKAPLFAVADGMGGHDGGDLASQAVVKRLNEIDGATGITRTEVNAALKAAVEDIHNEINGEDLGAGTTVTGVTFGRYKKAPTWDVFNIGDSRVYQFFKGYLTQITTDHSVVQHLVSSGAITPEEAETHPHANVITRAVGFNEEPIPDYYRLAIIPGQRLLICSDGLIKELTDIGIQHYLNVHKTAAEAAQELLNQALQNSGRDNITVIVIDVHAVGDDDESDPSDGTVEIDTLYNDTEEITPLGDTEEVVELASEDDADRIRALFAEDE